MCASACYVVTYMKHTNLQPCVAMAVPLAPYDCEAYEIASLVVVNTICSCRHVRQ